MAASRRSSLVLIFFRRVCVSVHACCTGGSSGVWPQRTSQTQHKHKHASLCAAISFRNIPLSTVADCTSFPLFRLSLCARAEPLNFAPRTIVSVAPSTRSRRPQRSGSRTRPHCAVWGSCRHHQITQNTRSGNSEPLFIPLHSSLLPPSCPASPDRNCPSLAVHRRRLPVRLFSPCEYPSSASPFMVLFYF